MANLDAQASQPPPSDPPGGPVIGLPGKNPADAFETVLNSFHLTYFGEPATHWLRALGAPEVAAAAKQIFAAMTLFRSHDYEDARATLRSAAAAIEELPADPPSVKILIERWYHSAAAYEHYLDGDLSAAYEALDAAQQSLNAVIAQHDFLIPLATHSIDFRTQRARIARRENRWREVRFHIDVVRRTFHGTFPFCELPDGRSISIQDLRGFYGALPEGAELSPSVLTLMDEGYPHDDTIDNLEEQIFTIPDFVIPYP